MKINTIYLNWQDRGDFRRFNFKKLKNVEGVSTMKKLNKAFDFLELRQNVSGGGGTQYG
ncbi:MAG: hypothetical protein LBT05_14550 [Planctomycetaceae bacterium]|jgi:hypothetical protein|nr:hypothetical protein [Planctomycetaceae bacterium]